MVLEQGQVERTESSVHNHDADYFFSLAHWAKKNNVLYRWERRLIFSIGTYISRGWQISGKQERQALRIMQLATQAGFSKGNGDQMVEPSLLARLVSKGYQLNRITVDMLGLTPGVLMELKRHGIYTIESLNSCSEADLLGMYSIGPGRFKDIKRILNKFLSSMLDEAAKEEEARADTTKQLFELAVRLCEVCEAQGVPRDLWLPSQARLILERATGENLETLADLRRLIETHSSKPHLVKRDRQANIEIDDIEHAIHWFSEVLTCSSVDDEINKLVGHLTERERFVLINRSSIEKHLTLEEIGCKLGVTRERVRQIEAKANKKLDRQLAKPLALFYSPAALLLLKRLGQDATIELWKKDLLNVGFLKAEASFDLLTVLARTTNIAPRVLSEELARLLKTHLPLRTLAAIKPVLKKARTICRNCGAVRALSLTNEQTSEEGVEQILRINGFEELHAGWWTRFNVECVPERVAMKVIAYCGSVSASSMRYALRRHLSRFQLPAPPSEVLAKLFERRGNFTVINGFIHLTKPPSMKPGLTAPEKIFLDMTLSNGPVLTFEAVHHKLVEAGLSTASVTSLLKYSPIVQKISTALYSTLGAKYDETNIQEAQEQLTRIPANSTLRVRSDGIIEFETNAGTWLEYGGVLASGPAASLKGEWKITNNGAESDLLTVDGNFMRGLSRISKTLGIIPGDRIRIDFNTWTREAEITKVVRNEQTPEYQNEIQ
jgi:hypothetical protein